MEIKFNLNVKKVSNRHPISIDVNTLRIVKTQYTLKEYQLVLTIAIFLKVSDFNGSL